MSPPLCFYKFLVSPKFEMQMGCSRRRLNCFDTLLIEPSSVSVKSIRKFEYDPATQTITFITKVADSAFVCYRILPSQLFQPISNRAISTYDNSTFRQTIQQSLVLPQKVFNFGSDIQKSGTISRGVTFGNRKNLFVNSTLNLQIQEKSLTM